MWFSQVDEAEGVEDDSVMAAVERKTKIRWATELETTEKSKAAHNAAATGLKSLLKHRGESQCFPFVEDIEQSIEVKVLPHIRPTRRGSGVTRLQAPVDFEEPDPAAWV